ncbi:transposase [Streptomyces sp. NPDC004266]|uniref:transposase n=1 Tax=Streptomyces sp. NPDC004266 TaxID=3364693 RepID=UPI00367398E6
MTTEPRGCLSDHWIGGPIGRNGEFSAARWTVIAPLLPPGGRARDQWRDHCQVLEGIMFTFRTGLPWRDLPERFGPWQTIHGRFARWAADGTFDRLLAASQTRAEVDRLIGSARMLSGNDGRSCGQRLRGRGGKKGETVQTPRAAGD